MKVTSASEIKTALTEMESELNQWKTAAEDFYEDIKNTKPEEVTLDEDMEGEEITPDMGGGEGEGNKKHPIEIKTPEDAKKVLDEAKEDIQSVVDNIEGVMGEGKEEGEKVAFKRINDRYASTLQNLSNKAANAIEDTKKSLNHWAFLKKRITKSAKIDTTSITHPELKQVANTLEQMSLLDKILAKAGYIKKGALKTEATAVPPTGAEFSGDKWPNKKNPAEVELRHYQAGVDEFGRVNKKYNSNPNPAVDPRLKDEVAPHEEKPYVNASYNDIIRGYDVYDPKTKKAIRFTLANAPSEAGRKDELGLKGFASKQFATQVCDAIVENGIEWVRQQMNGQYLNETLAKQAAKSDKSSTRKYYAEAFGDASYAKELTSGKETDKMDTAYKPEKDKVENNADNPDFGKAKDGTGKISSQEEKDILKAKARKGVELARKAAAAGVIEFNVNEIKKYAKEMMNESDEVIAYAEKTLNNMPLVNEAALDKEATIPDADSGIVGNKLQGVSNTKAKAETEGTINNNVESDAKIAKKANIVPQFNTNVPSNLSISSMFTTVEKKLQGKNVNLDQTRMRKAQYRNH